MGESFNQDLSTHSLKFRLTCLCVCAALTVGVFTSGILLHAYQDNAKNDLISSTEFNLHLVAGLIDQELSAVDDLRSWCRSNASISEYLADPKAPPAATLRLYKQLSADFSSHRGYTSVRRMIFTNIQHSRVLQFGNELTDSLPLTLGMLDQIPALQDPDKYRQWSSPMEDVFSHVPKRQYLVCVTPIYKEFSTQLAGWLYTEVPADIIRKPLENYMLEDGSRLYLTVGNTTCQIKDGWFHCGPQAERLQASRQSAQSGTTLLHEGNGFLAVTCCAGERSLWLTQTLPNRLFELRFGPYLPQLALLFILALLFGAALLRWLSHTISLPVERLRRRIFDMSMGDFRIDPSIEGDDEFGEIGRGINDLARSTVILMDKRVEDEKRKKDLEYQILQSQINPHFLYNTLNSIRWMATIQNASGIAEMTTALARLLKSVAKKTDSLIPLREELSLLDDYFTILKYRYGNAMSLFKVIDERLLDNVIPHFTLQPLLENAIFHGLEPAGGAGHLTIEVSSDGGERVLISVSDDGVGMDEATAAALLSDAPGKPNGLFHKVGLSNVHKRIRYEFGEAYGLSISSRIGQYTKVTVTLPRRVYTPPEGDPS